jgi:hypothetical protein
VLKFRLGKVCYVVGYNVCHSGSNRQFDCRLGFAAFFGDQVGWFGHLARSMVGLIWTVARLAADLAYNTEKLTESC